MVVSFGTQNRKVVVNEALSLGSVKEIVRNKFEFAEADLLQYYDDDVSDWIDLDESTLEYISEQKVVKIKLIKKSSSDVSNDGQSGQATPSGKSPTTAAEGISRPLTPSSRPSTPSSRPSTPLSRPCTPSSTSRPSTPSSRPPTPSTPASSQESKFVNRLKTSRY